MDGTSQSDARRATEQRRRPPAPPVSILATFHNGTLWRDNDAPAPTDLTLEVTNAEGEVAAWFDDFWWTEVLERWGDEPVTLHIAATPNALVHRAVLHQLEMVSRIAARWRIVGHAWRDALATDESVRELARSPYHEVRILDESGPPALPGENRPAGWPVDELFGRIRREQADVGAVRPILVRLPSRSPHFVRG